MYQNCNCISVNRLDLLGHRCVPLSVCRNADVPSAGTEFGRRKNRKKRIYALAALCVNANTETKMHFIFVS